MPSKDAELASSSDHNPQQAPPFLTLEETTTADTTNLMQHADLIVQEDRTRKRSSQQSALMANNGSEHSYEVDDEEDKHRKSASATTLKKRGSSSRCSLKTVLSYAMFTVIFLIIWDAIFTPPEKRWIQPSHTDGFLKWVQQHPIQGLFAIIVVIAGAVVVLVPIGTPLTLGCGYIYKGAYGWKLGLTLATLVSMGGSALGAVICFLLGRYLFRDQVRQWARNKYPLFDAIDTGTFEHHLDFDERTLFSLILISTQRRRSTDYVSWPCFILRLFCLWVLFRTCVAQRQWLSAHLSLRKLPLFHSCCCTVSLERQLEH